jgi:hypothetical protein
MTTSARQHYLATRETVQIGVKLEKRQVKVLKALAELTDTSLGDLLESLVLHAFAHELPFDETLLQQTEQLKRVYGMDYDLQVAHRFTNAATIQPKLITGNGRRESDA